MGFTGREEENGRGLLQSKSVCGLYLWEEDEDC